MAHTVRLDSCPLRRTRTFLILALCLILAANGSVKGQGGSLTYIYDELGRLVAVVDPAGDTARYTYDSVGNLISISRFSSSVVSILHFSPNKGPVGIPVTIHGTSFSTTTSQNTVTFNGVAATVTSATANEIVTSVPAGATTGPISVTTPAGSATSDTPFTVNTSVEPTITSFTPTMGTPGTALTITGTNFETTVANDWVTLNNHYALVSSATSTAISTAVPTQATSGRISVATPAGKATSVADFFVPPTPFAATDVEVIGRMNFGESKTVAISTANKIGLILFDGTALQRASLKVNSFSMTICRVAIYNPDGTELASTNFYANGGFLDTPLLPATGTYTILIDPVGTNTGSIDYTLYNATDVTGTITPGGPPVTVTTTTPGQNARLTFTATAGQRVSLQLSNSTFSGCYGVYDVIKAPDGSTLASSGLCTATGFVDSAVLPVAGYYTLLVDPQGATTGSQTLLLNNVPPDVSGPITPGGSAVTITTTTPGQNAVLTFSGTANQRLSLKATGVSLTGGSYNWVTLSIKKPDGTTLASSVFDNSGGFIDVQTLPVAGTYTVFADLWDTSTGGMTLTLFDVPADVSVSVTPGGAPVTITNTTPGQNGRATFAGTANQRVSLNITGVSVTGGYHNWVTVSLKNPDGSTLTSGVFDSSGGFFDAQTLASSGTYTILVDPWDTAIGSAILTLNDVPADATGSITVGGAALTLSTTVAGQNAKGTFSGTSGQQVSVAFTNNTMGTVTASLLKPDGTSLTSLTSNASSFNLSTQTLPTSGTYSVKVDPNGTNAGSITISVTEIAPATLQADYQFQNTRNSSVGSPPALVDLGTNSFSTATVDGTSTTVLAFTQNDGLSFSPTTGVVPSNSCSIVMLFSFSQTSGYRRILDFKNGTSDNGQYQQNGHLYFYPSGYGSPVSIPANTYVQVVITRDTTGTVTGYVDGVQQFQFSDSSSLGVIDGSNTLRFFRDDNTANEASAGAVARIRLYSGALTASQVAALSRLP